MTLKWQQKSPWYMDSVCKKFRISKALIHGVPYYLLWDGKQIIGQRHPSAESAQAAANEWLLLLTQARTS